MQTEEEATINLNRINQEAQQSGGCPWSLSFSFGRSLQVGGCLPFCGRSLCVLGLDGTRDEGRHALL